MIGISSVASEPVAPPRCTAKAAPMARKRPLLIFDSGVGGLSVLRPIRALLPTAPIVYAADNAGYPYGTKSEAEVAARVPALLGRTAERFDSAPLVNACNTPSDNTIDAVRAARALPLARN